MSIDWITVLAQLANFFVLIWLLRRFLYQPILDGIDAREAAIAARLADAERAREEARAAEANYRQLAEDSRAGQEQAIADALQATRDERERILAEGHAQMEQEHQAWRRHLEVERENFLEKLQHSGAQTLSELTRRILKDLADEPLENAIARQLLRRLQPALADLRAAGETTQSVRLTTRHALAADQQSALRNQLAPALPGMHWEFRSDTTQDCGLALQVGSVRVVWTIDSYMDEFERIQAQLLPDALPAERP